MEQDGLGLSGLLYDQELRAVAHELRRRAGLPPAKDWQLKLPADAPPW